MEEHDVLVSVAHADGIAAVVRTGADGLLWVTGDHRRGGSGLQGYRPTIEGLTDDRTVQGGALPPGAVAAEVVDDAGVVHAAAAANGAWVVVLDQPATGDTSPVRFLDPQGETVTPPLPAEWSRAPVADAEESCPACGASSWLEVRPLDDSRGARTTDSGAWEPTPIVVCSVCGHEESIGAFLRFEDDDPTDDEQQPGLRARTLQALVRRQERAAMRRVRFPVYVAAGWTPRLGGWGSSSRRDTHSVTVCHGADPPEPGPALTIETESRDERGHESERALASQALERALPDEAGGWPERSEAGLTVWLRTRDRDCRRAAANATSSRHPLRIDGRAETFEVVETATAWAAARRHGDLLITLTASAIPPDDIALETLDDATLITSDGPA